MHFIKAESGQVINTETIARLYVATADVRKREATTMRAELVNGTAAILASFPRIETAPDSQKLANARAQTVLDALTQKLLIVHSLIDMNEIKSEALEPVAV